MGLLNPIVVGEMRSRRNIRDTDVARIRKMLFEGGRIAESDADTLLALNRTCPVQDASWSGLVVEAIADYIIEQVEPLGYLTVTNADWLIGRISQAGRIETKVELEVIIHVLDKARWAPSSLSAFALAQVLHGVILGDGPIRQAAKIEPGCISEAEVALLARILVAFGGEECVALSRAEAEVLLDINDAVRDGGGHASWNDLFVRSIASAVMSASGYRVPSRPTALGQEHRLARGNERGPDSLPATAGGSRRGLLAGYKPQTPEQRSLMRLEQQRLEIITSERVTEGEAQWLADRLGGDGRRIGNVAELLRLLKVEGPSLHPALRLLVERAERAA